MNASLVGLATMMEGSFQGTVDSFIAKEMMDAATFAGITLDPTKVAVAAEVDRTLLFAMANLGIAHFTAGIPAPVKK